MRRQAKLCRSCKHESKKQDLRCVVVIENFDAALMKVDRSISILFHNNRSLRSTLLLGTDNPQALSPSHRCNVDYVFIHARDFCNDRNKINESFCQMIPTFDQFCAMLDTHAQNCETLVIDLAGQNADNLQEYVFTYKA